MYWDYVENCCNYFTSGSVLKILKDEKHDIW